VDPEADDGQAAVPTRRERGNVVGQTGAVGDGLEPHVGGHGADGSPDTDQPKGPRYAMNNSESAQDTAPTTEQIAAAGTAGSTDRTSPRQHPLADGQAQQPAPAAHAAVASDPGASGQPPTPLLEDDELQSILVRWKDIQAEFVDEPRKAVQDADSLVADLMQRLARMFASERDQLESRWAGGDEVSTEDLRRGLRRYRSFFERLLAA
jgi:hypothetical protein